MSQSSDHTAREIDRRVYQHHALLALLRARGKEGATNVELSHEVGLRFGGRIHELRKEGHNIVKAHVGGGLWRYWLSSMSLSAQGGGVATSRSGLRQGPMELTRLDSTQPALPSRAEEQRGQLDLLPPPPPRSVVPEYPR